MSSASVENNVKIFPWANPHCSDSGRTPRPSLIGSLLKPTNIMQPLSNSTLWTTTHRSPNTHLTEL